MLPPRRKSGKFVLGSQGRGGAVRTRLLHSMNSVGDSAFHCQLLISYHEDNHFRGDFYLFIAFLTLYD